MGPCFFAACAQDPKTVQGKMVRVAGSRDPEDRVVERGGRKATPFGETDAHAMENYCTHRGKDGYAVFGEIPEASR